LICSFEFLLKLVAPITIKTPKGYNIRRKAFEDGASNWLFACFDVVWECAEANANVGLPLLCPRGIAHNVCAYAVRGTGGLKNEAQRNAKPDLLQTVPRDRPTL
jgi:hypothetical protein